MLLEESNEHSGLTWPQLRQDPVITLTGLLFLVLDGVQK